MNAADFDQICEQGRGPGGASSCGTFHVGHITGGGGFPGSFGGDYHLPPASTIGSIAESDAETAAVESAVKRGLQ